MIKKNSLLGIFMFVALSTVQTAYACSCAVRTPQMNFEYADVVFVGKVREVNSSWGEQRVEFDVEEIQKTVEDFDEERLTVYSNSDEAACGYMFQKGGVYQVFATLQDNDRLTTNLCSGNQRYRR